MRIGVCGLIGSSPGFQGGDFALLIKHLLDRPLAWSPEEKIIYRDLREFTAPVAPGVDLQGLGADLPGLAPAAELETYKGFRIIPEPIKDTGGYRVCARIEKEVDGESRSHRMIRADMCSSEDQAREISTAKARVLIDERGEALFG